MDAQGRKDAVQLAGEVGPSEAARRLGMSKTTLLRWTAADRDGPDRKKGAGTPRRKVPRPSSAPRARESTDTAAAFDKLAPEVKQELRAGLREASRFIATGGIVEESKTDASGKTTTRKFRDARAFMQTATALRTLLQIAPGISAFDTDTGGESASTDDIAAVSRAMADPPPAPPLRLVTPEETKA